MTPPPPHPTATPTHRFAKAMSQLDTRRFVKLKFDGARAGGLPLRAELYAARKRGVNLCTFTAAGSAEDDESDMPSMGPSMSSSGGQSGGQSGGCLADPNRSAFFSIVCVFVLVYFSRLFVFSVLIHCVHTARYFWAVVLNSSLVWCVCGSLFLTDSDC